jgi:hypothetical protein
MCSQCPKEHWPRRGAHPDLSLALAKVARALLGLGRGKDARATAERALAALDPTKASALTLARTRFILARALWETAGDRARARELAVQARNSYAEAARAGAGVDDEMAEVEAGLRADLHRRGLPP